MQSTTNRVRYYVENHAASYYEPVMQSVEQLLRCGVNMNRVVADLKEEICVLALLRHRYHQGKAAEWLGIHPNTFNRQIHAWIRRKQRAVHGAAS